MRGRIRDLIPLGNKAIMSVEVDEQAGSLEKYSGKELTIKVSQYRKPRSNDANALLWHCLGEMAAVLRADKWDLYLMMLKRYGKFTYLLIKPEALDAMRASWRESEVVGQGFLENGHRMIQLLVYFGSSSYNSQEFSTLLDGVISEMKEMGMDTPTSTEMKATLEAWEKEHG